MIGEFAPEIRDIEHVVVDHARDRYAGHPRQGGIFNFCDGEITIIYYRAPCRYETRTDIQHDYGGYHSRAQAIMARSLDNGRTWDRAHDVAIYDEAKPIEERRSFLGQVQENPSLVRQAIDLSARDTAIFFGRTYAGQGDPPRMICFAVRSADRGRTWESVPTIVPPPAGYETVHKDGHPLVQMPDGTQLAAMSGGGVHLYGSDDNGLSWEPLARMARDPTGDGRPTYAGLLLLPSGRLQGYQLNINGWRDAIQMNYSDDGGYSWSEPKPIVRWGKSPWVARRRAGDKTRGRRGKFYRSPWPMLLADGRIVVLFARRKLPYGIGVIVSEDGGQNWSQEAVLRDDASITDLGYPVATEIEPGRIFTAYYYTLDDGNGFNGTRFIAGTLFGLG